MKPGCSLPLQPDNIIGENWALSGVNTAWEAAAVLLPTGGRTLP
jgi:hypothetical protein